VPRPTAVRRPPVPARLPFYYGWVVVAVAFVTMAIAVNSRTAFSLLFPPLLDEFDWPRGVTAGAFSTGFLVSTLYAPLIGYLMDRWGPRYVIPSSALMVGIGLAAATLTRQPWHLYATLGALMVGGSIAMSYVGHGAFLPNWFSRRRGLAIGIAYSGVGVGSIVMLPWLQDLIDAQGWRYACWTLAFLVLAIAPLNLVLQRGRPRDLGLEPDGVPPAPPAPSGAATDAQRVAIIDPARAMTDWTLRRAAGTARFWWLAVGFFCGLYAWYAVLVHQTRYLIDIGFDPGIAARALALVALFGIAGQIAIGHLSDRIGREWAWTIGSMGFIICLLLLLHLQARPEPVLMYAMVAAQGLLGYSLAPFYAAIPADLFQGRSYGTIYGTLSLTSTLGAAAGPWGTGYLYDLTGGYTAAFWLALFLVLVSIGCIWCAGPRKVRSVAG
jgi:MFS family permease